MHTDPQPQGAVWFRHQLKPSVMAGAGPWQHVPFGKYMLFVEVGMCSRTHRALAGSNFTYYFMPRCQAPAPVLQGPTAWNFRSGTGEIQLGSSQLFHWVLLVFPCHLAAAVQLRWVLTAGAATIPSVSGFLLERRPTAHHACWVRYLLPECPDTVSDRATENTPVLGCREPGSLVSCCLSEGSFQSSGSAFSCLARKITALVKL